MPAVRLLLGLALAWLVAALLGRWVTSGLLLLDPFLLLTLWAGVRRDPPWGTVTGFASGLTQDALVGSLFGVHGFSKTLIGWLSHGLGGRLVLSSPAPLLLILVGCTLLDRFLLAFLSLLLRGTFPLPPVGSLLLLCLTNALAGLLLFRLAAPRSRELSWSA